MDHSFNDPRSRGLKTILLSFFSHVFFLNFSVFSFGSRLTYPGPQFVFLGGILQKQDLVNDTADPKDPNIMPHHWPLQEPAAPRDFTAVEKPSFSASATGEKILFKASLEDSPQAQEKDPRKNTEGRDKEEQVPAYRSLRLYRQ